MGRRLRLGLLCGLLFLLGIEAGTQGWAQTPKTGPEASHADLADHLRLGQSAFPLNGPWKFTLGDSPIDPKTGQPLWADPGFDDSKWETVDLTPAEGSLEPLAGTSGYVPGWTAKGPRGLLGLCLVPHPGAA